jgi:flagellar export protein FliJ
MAFRFRAQAALDLRARELQEAQRELARAEEVRDAARHAVHEAYAALLSARAEAAEAQRAPGDATRFEWYRLWIVRLDYERAAHAKTLAAREEDVTRAIAKCLQARQRCESLERFKENARRAYDERERAIERKDLDELATRRFVSGQRSHDGARV